MRLHSFKKIKPVWMNDLPSVVQPTDVNYLDSKIFLTTGHVFKDWDSKSCEMNLVYAWTFSLQWWLVKSIVWFCTGPRLKLLFARSVHFVLKAFRANISNAKILIKIVSKILCDNGNHVIFQCLFLKWIWFSNRLPYHFCFIEIFQEWIK